MYIIIKSNQGDHAGQDRIWSKLSVVGTKEEVFTSLTEYALATSDNTEEHEEYVIDKDFEDVPIYIKGEYSFEDDGYKYVALGIDSIRPFFQDRTNGKTPSFIIGLIRFCTDPLIKAHSKHS